MLPRESNVIKTNDILMMIMQLLTIFFKIILLQLETRKDYNPNTKIIYLLNNN